MKNSKKQFTWPRLSLFFLVLFTSFNGGDNRSQYNVPVAAKSIYAVDIDLDGSNDIIVGHLTAWQHFNPTITIMKNINHGFFEITDTSRIFTGYQENIFAIDVNNDDYPDIVTFYSDFSSGHAERFIRVFYNVQGDFPNNSDFSLNSSSTFSDITYGDVNGDTAIDLIVASNQDQFWGVLYNDGNGNFSLPEYHYITDYYPTSIVCDDLNNDGRDDMVICGQSTEIYFSYPGEFQSLVLESSDFKDGVWIADFDNDGKNDILTFVGIPVVNVTSLIMYRNLGNNTFERLPEFSFTSISSRFFVTEFNNDSLPDILFQLFNDSGYVIYYNQGDFQLGDSAFVPVDYYGEPWRNCFCADLDGNGDNDILTVRTSYNQLPANLDIKFNDGKGHFVDQPLGIKDKNTIEAHQILRNFPNPFSEKTTIEFFLRETSKVSLSIYDTRGNILTCLIDKRMSEGIHYAIWNRADKGCGYCKPGIYFAVLKTSENGCTNIKLLAY
jgi:hypothetical protein